MEEGWAKKPEEQKEQSETEAEEQVSQLAAQAE